VKVFFPLKGFLHFVSHLHRFNDLRRVFPMVGFYLRNQMRKSVRIMNAKYKKQKLRIFYEACKHPSVRENIMINPA